ncbi:MAG: hypothetical protein ACJAX2_003009 [Celeribacter sp.]|jgi:hypothetical protein
MMFMCTLGVNSGPRTILPLWMQALSLFQSADNGGDPVSAHRLMSLMNTHTDDNAHTGDESRQDHL